MAFDRMLNEVSDTLLPPMRNLREKLACDDMMVMFAPVVNAAVVVFL